MCCSDNQWRRSLPHEAACGDETPPQGVNDDLVYTSTHTAQGSGLTVTINPSQNTTCVIHRMAPITPYTWFVTDNSAKCPEQAADGWQVPFTRDDSNLVFLLVESAIWVESSVGLAHNGRASHQHIQWLQYGLIWVDRTSQGATHRISYGLSWCYLYSSEGWWHKHADMNLLSSGDLKRIHPFTQFYLWDANRM